MGLKFNRKRRAEETYHLISLITKMISPLFYKNKRKVNRGFFN